MDIDGCRKISDKIIIVCGRQCPLPSGIRRQRQYHSDFAVPVANGQPWSMQVGTRESMVHSKVSNTSVIQHDPLDPQVSRHSAKQAVVFLYPDFRSLELIMEVQHSNADGITAVESQGPYTGATKCSPSLVS